MIARAAWKAVSGRDLYVLPFLLLLAGFVVVALLAPWIAPRDPNAQFLMGRLKPPGTSLRGVEYWLGTDEVGRDLVSRVIWGARISLLVAS